MPQHSQRLKTAGHQRRISLRSEKTGLEEGTEATVGRRGEECAWGWEEPAPAASSDARSWGRALAGLKPSVAPLSPRPVPAAGLRTGLLGSGGSIRGCGGGGGASLCPPLSAPLLPPGSPLAAPLPARAGCPEPLAVPAGALLRLRHLSWRRPVWVGGWVGVGGGVGGGGGQPQAGWAVEQAREGHRLRAEGVFTWDRIWRPLGLAGWAEERQGRPGRG